MPTQKKPRFSGRRVVVVLALALLICMLLTSCFADRNGETTNIFIVVLVRPFAYILRWIYDWCNSFGWALILFTLLTRLVLLPLNIKSKKGMAAMQALQPKLKELEKKYQNDKQKYQEEVAKLYKKEGVSPMGGCLPTLLTLPIMFALYWPISQPLKYLMNLSAAQIAAVRDQLILIGAKVNGVLVSATSSEMTLVQAMHDNFEAVSSISENIFPMNLMFLGINLGAVPSFTKFNVLFLLPIISAGTAFLLSKITTWLQERSTGVQNSQQNGMMTWMMPLISLWIGFSLPAGLTVYWIASNLVAMAQEVFTTYYIQKKKEKEPLKEADSSNDKNSRSNRKNNR